MPLASGPLASRRSPEAGRFRMSAARRSRAGMCRNIVPVEQSRSPPPRMRSATTPRSSTSRKIAGTTKPSQANQAGRSTAPSRRSRTPRADLLAGLVTTAPPKSREEEAEKRRARSADRYEALRAFQQENGRRAPARSRRRGRGRRRDASSPRRHPMFPVRPPVVVRVRSPPDSEGIRMCDHDAPDSRPRRHGCRAAPARILAPRHAPHRRHRARRGSADDGRGSGGSVTGRGERAGEAARCSAPADLAGGRPPRAHAVQPRREVPDRPAARRRAALRRGLARVHRAQQLRPRRAGTARRARAAAERARLPQTC